MDDKTGAFQNVTFHGGTQCLGCGSAQPQHRIKGVESEYITMAAVIRTGATVSDAPPVIATLDGIPGQVASIGGRQFAAIGWQIEDQPMGPLSVGSGRLFDNQYQGSRPLGHTTPLQRG